MDRGWGAIVCRDSHMPSETLPPFASPSKLKSSTTCHNRRSEGYYSARIGVREGLKENLPWEDENRPRAVQYEYVKILD